MHTGHIPSHFDNFFESYNYIENNYNLCRINNLKTERYIMLQCRCIKKTDKLYLEMSDSQNLPAMKVQGTASNPKLYAVFTRSPSENNIQSRYNLIYP
jgi:hypothetical protein